MSTLRDLHESKTLMAAFLECSEEHVKDAVRQHIGEERERWAKSRDNPCRERSLRAMLNEVPWLKRFDKKNRKRSSLVPDRFAAPGRLVGGNVSWNALIVRWAREAWGIRAKDADEARRLCLDLHPEVYGPHGDEGPWKHDRDVYDATDGPSFTAVPTVAQTAVRPRRMTAPKVRRVV
jgi:hypothetical protein